MKNFWAFLFGIGFIFILNACSPVYKTEYSFSAPETFEGKTCANNCLDGRQSCFNSCEEKERICLEEAKLDAKIAYLEYLSRKVINEQEADKSLSDFERSSQNHCNTNSCDRQCEDSHRICHVNCGGGVTERKYCSAFCD